MTKYLELIDHKALFISGTIILVLALVSITWYYGKLRAKTRQHHSSHLSKGLPPLGDRIATCARTVFWTASVAITIVSAIVLLGLAIAYATSILPTFHSIEAQRTQQLDNNMVNNTMTAIALVVAVVTLILTVGTSWFANVNRQLDEKLLLVQNVLAKNRAREELELQQRELQLLLFAAKKGAFDWTKTRVDEKHLALQLQEVFSRLELLVIDDLEGRKRSFNWLHNHFQPWTDNLERVREYSEGCHRLALARAWYENESLPPSEQTRLEKAGLACRFFDRQEWKRINPS
jgi:hypothetical protein